MRSFREVKLDQEARDEFCASMSNAHRYVYELLRDSEGEPMIITSDGELLASVEYFDGRCWVTAHVPFEYGVRLEAVGVAREVERAAEPRCSPSSEEASRA